MGIKIEDNLTFALEGMIKKAGETRKLMNVIAQDIVKETNLNFRGEKDPDGKKWEKTKRGGKILQDTGRLRSSISGEATADEAKAGTNLKYAAIHQFGYPKKMPKRSYIGITKKMKERYSEMYFKHLKGELK